MTNTPQVAASANPLAAWSSTRRQLVGARLRLGWTQAHVAAKAGVGERTIQRWEAGDAEPRALELYKWMHVLSIPYPPQVAATQSPEVQHA